MLARYFLLLVLVIFSHSSLSSDMSEFYRDISKETLISARNGNADSQFSIGVFFEMHEANGTDKYAIYWYTLAAKQGHYMSQFNLGQMYYTGRGVGKNIKTSIFYIKRAYFGGSRYAATFLANLCEKGIGVPKDLMGAIHLYKIADKRGESSADDLALAIGSRFPETMWYADPNVAPLDYYNPLEKM